MRGSILALAAACALVAPVLAQTRAPADMVRERQEGYRQMADALKGVSGQLRASDPSLAEIRRHGAVLDRNAVRVLGWFPAGTGAESGVRTRALPRIWSDHQGFRTAGARLLVAVRELNAAVARNDVDGIRASARAVGAACSACHDAYRGPDR